GRSSSLPDRASGSSVDGAPPPDEDHAASQLAELGVARWLVVIIAIVGIAVFAGLAVPGVEEVADAGGVFWLFAILLALGEWFPITAPRRDGAEAEEISTSTTFAFTLLILYGAGPACLTLAVASVIGDLRQRKSIWKALYNIAQYMLALAAAGLVYAL